MQPDIEWQLQATHDELNRSLERGQRQLRRLAIGYGIFLAIWIQFMAYAFGAREAVRFYTFELAMAYTLMIAYWWLGRVIERNRLLVEQQQTIERAYRCWLSAQQARETLYYDQLTRQWLWMIGYYPPKGKFARKRHGRKYPSYV